MATSFSFVTSYLKCYVLGETVSKIPPALNSIALDHDIYLYLTSGISLLLPAIAWVPD